MEEKLSNSEIMWYGLLVILFITSNIYAYEFFQKQKYNHVTQSYCGSILKKSSEEVAIKHGSRTDLYLLMQFDNLPVRAIDVSETTYLSHNIGDRLCFNLDNFDVGKGVDVEWYHFIFTIVAGLLDLMCFVVILTEGIPFMNKKIDQLRLPVKQKPALVKKSVPDKTQFRI